MPFATFLSIVGACVGFASAIFFAVGTLRLRAREVADIASTFWDFNKHLADSIAWQRSEYVAGAFLLLLSFAAQLASNFVSPSFTPAFLAKQPVCAITVLLLVVVIAAVALTRALAKSTLRDVLELLEQRTRIDEQRPLTS